MFSVIIIIIITNLLTVKEPRKLGDKFQGNDLQPNVSIILINTYNQN